MSGTLYLVGTPIGNLGDISPRAAETFEAVDFIAAEDTRVTVKLLNHLGIKKPMVSYYEHNRAESGERILARLLNGESCALATDAGMPAISDPGEDLVALCGEAGVPVIAIPGPCAAVCALALSGLPTGRFTFEGFLSTVKKNRYKHLEELKNEHRTMIFYEAPHKLKATLSDMLTYFGDRPITISRELTKLHEETLRFTLAKAVEYYESTPPKGEFVLIIQGAPTDEETPLTMEEAMEQVSALMDKGQSLKDSVKQVAKSTGFAKNKLYDAVLKAQN
ncbi:MAG: 16S rRNA (cytidine(1402)-2'-O)-methyltransferase [Ruminococcaceae bacterium]|nr:16S rRNA (cytidine(1402)-2'-O)-methyltransferase [Oscillospiraceae bacterium]